MKYFFYFNPEDNKVALYSKGLNQMPEKFSVLELEVTEEEKALIEQNYELFIINEKLILKKRESTIKEEQLVEIEKAKKNLREKLDKGEVKKLEDLLPLLSKIL